jgi:hypothetical protein
MSWSTFLKAHWDAIAAADFFGVEVLTRGGLVRYLVFFVIELRTRRVHIAGIGCNPQGAWMVQLARNLTDATSGFLKGARHLIVDRDPPYTAQFESTFAAAGVELIRLPPSSPNLNAYAAIFVRSRRTGSSPREQTPRRTSPCLGATGMGQARRMIGGRTNTGRYLSVFVLARTRLLTWDVSATAPAFSDSSPDIGPRRG